MAASYTLELELAGAGAGWTDVTADLVDQPIKARRGFQSSTVDDLIAAPSTLSFALNNSTTNAAHTRGYYSLDSAGKRSGWQMGIGVRFKVTANGTTRVRFVGSIQSIAPVAGVFEEQTVACAALSWLDDAARAPFTGVTAQVNKRDDQLVTSLVGQVPRAPTATAFTTGLEVLPYSLDDLDTTKATILDGLDSAVRSGFSRLYEKADGTLVLEGRALRQTFAVDTLTLTDTATVVNPGLALTGLQPGRTREQIINRVLVTVHPRRVDAAPVVLYALQTSGTPASIPANNSVTFHGVFVDPTQQSQQIGGFNTLISDGGSGAVVGTSGNLPTADFAFGSSAGLSDLSASCSVSVVYTATDVTFTVTNNGSIAAVVTLLQCRGQGIYSYQAITSVANDASSQTQYGLRSQSIDCPYQASAPFAASAAQYALRARSTGVTMLDSGVRLSVHAGDEISMDSLLQREISHAIAVTETVSSLSAGKYWINAIEEEYDTRANATFVFYLTPRDPQPVWAWGIAGQSEWGLTTYYGF